MMLQCSVAQAVKNERPARVTGVRPTRATLNLGAERVPMVQRQLTGRLMVESLHLWQWKKEQPSELANRL